MSAKKIWALLDERQGNTSQTLGVAEALGLPFEMKNIRFNPLIRLPNFLLHSNTLGISKSSLSELAPPWPDIVLSTARRLGIVASYIKSQHPDTFLAQIQWPGFPSSQFDLIAAPLHDEAPEGKNILTTIGAPHRVTEKTLHDKADYWRTRLPELPSPKIALLVGGSARSRDFGEKEARELALLSSDLVNSLKGSLLVTTSRRTGAEATASLARNIQCPHYIHTWNDADSPEANPYYGFLGLADVVIATGESVSLCSEGCATGKPVFVYTTEGLISPKQQKFLQELYDRKLAKPLRQKNNELFVPPYRLSDALSVAAEIRKRAL